MYKVPFYILLLTSLLLVSCSPGTDEVIDTPPEIPVEPEPVEPPSPINWETCSGVPLDHPCNLELQNQFGGTFNLYDHYGSPIVLDFSTMWCGPCQRASQVAQEYYENYAPEGLIYAVVLIENADREDPSETDLIEWANTKGITSVPVLAGSRDLLMSSGGDWYLTGWPTFYFIDEEMVIQQVLRGWSEEIVNDFTEDLLQ